MTFGDRSLADRGESRPPDGSVARTRRALRATAFAEAGIERCVILSGSFRAGTSFVGSLLGKNGLAGISKERFARFSEFRLKPSRVPSEGPVELDRQRFEGDEARFTEALSELLEDAQAGLFTAKMMWPHRNNFALSMGFERQDSLAFARSFPNAKWINIARRDKAAQAISFWRAKLTGRWHVRSEEDEPAVEYDFGDIRKCYVELSAHDMLLRDFHEQAGTDAVHLTYEDFLADVPGALEDLLSYTASHRLHGEDRATRSPLRRQADSLSLELRERFLADLYRTGY